jgi:hypothetical protein
VAVANDVHRAAVFSKEDGGDARLRLKTPASAWRSRADGAASDARPRAKKVGSPEGSRADGRTGS